MKYKYIFESPIKYLVTSEDNDFEDNEYNLEDLKYDFNNKLGYLSDKELKKLTIHFSEYMNNPGIKDITFNIHDGKQLTTVVIMDHQLKKKEFTKLYTDIQSQLKVGLGQKLIEIPLIEFKDNIESVKNDGTKVYKPVKKQIFCMLSYDDGWVLKFVNRSEQELKDNNIRYKKVDDKIKVDLHDNPLFNTNSLEF